MLTREKRQARQQVEMLIFIKGGLLMDEKFDYIARTLSRTKRKDYENYVVNAIWNRLSTSELKPVSQQYIKHDKGYYLIDLYFPQLNIGIECDEGHHKYVSDKDLQREMTIFDVLKQINHTNEYTALHIDVTKSYSRIEDEINAHVKTILSAMEEQKAKGCFADWRFALMNSEGKNGMEEQRFTKDFISVSDDISFRTIAEVCGTLFSAQSVPMRKGYFIPHTFKEKFGVQYKVWFPKLAVNNKAVTRDWNNSLSQDGKTIIEFPNSPQYDPETWLPKHNDVPRVTFPKAKNPVTNKDEYRFAGVFELKDIKGIKKYFTRIAESFPVIKNSELS